MQLAPTTEIFNKAVYLFFKKWKKEKKFLEYFQSEWVTCHSNWFEGVAYNVPSTNNCLEAFNSVIKKEVTFRERLPISRVLQTAKTTVENWWLEFDNESLKRDAKSTKKDEEEGLN